ncbi:DinB family protein [Bacillus subtilis]
MSQSNQIVSHFLSHRNVTNELAEKISKDHYSYKPADTSMSAEELVKHILTSFHLFANVIKEGNASPFQNKQEETETETDLNVLAKTYTDKTVAILEQLTEEQLDREIDLTSAFGRKVTGRALLQLAMEHEIHHKGNLFVYVREMGHTELPFYQQRM